MNKDELLALGLSEEQAEKVLAEMNALQNTVKERDKQLADLQKAAVGNEELQNQIAALQQQNAEQTRAHKAEMQQLKLDNAIDGALAAAGARNGKAVRALLDLSGVKLGEDGKLAGFDEQLAALRQSDGYLFAAVSGNTMRGFQPGASSSVPAGQVDTRKMNYEQLCAYMEQNPGAELQ